VIAEGNPSRSCHVVASVGEAHYGSRTRVAQIEHALGDELRVEAIAERIDADGRDDEPKYARTVLAAGKGNQAETICAARGNRKS
jgi:hypothetical protein